MNITVIRHGKTKSNGENRYMGTIDEPLSAEGIQALQDNRARQIYPEASRLFVSPLKRCVETAALLYPTVSPIILEGFREISFGDFEGKTYDEIVAESDYDQAKMTDDAFTFPAGENVKRFKMRVMDTFWQAVDESAGDDCVIVCHGGVMMALRQGLFGGEFYEGYVKNGQALQITFDKQTQSASFIGRIE